MFARHYSLTMKSYLSFLGVLCLVHHLPLTTADFNFQFELQSISTNGNCFGDDLTLDCETYLGFFCLRPGPRSSTSTSASDCAFGTSGRFGPGGSLPITRVIPSTLPWSGSFQMFVRARDEDDPGNDDDIDAIFINDSLQPNGLYTPSRDYPGLNNKVTVRMRYRVTCQANYYGSDCDTLCVPQNDPTNGHYTCNSDGSIACRSGYENTENNCRDRITACSHSPCLQDAPCTAVGVIDFMCDCPPGYTSKDCGVNINECEPGPCVNGGNCTDGVASYSCVCPPGFSGMNCEVDLNECMEMDVDCPGNSTCVDGIGSYSCVCNEGFEGDNCTEIDPCSDDPCTHGCSCISMGPFDYHCLCPPTTAPIGVANGNGGSTAPTAGATQPVRGPNAVMAAVGAVLGVMLVLVVVIIVVITVLCVLRRKNRKGRTLYEMTESSSRNGTLKNHEPTSEAHIYQTPNEALYSSSEGSEALITNPLYGSNPTTPLHNHPPPANGAQASLTLQSAKSNDTLHDVDNPLYGDNPPHLPMSSPTLQGPIYSVPQPASEEAKREAVNYPYSYASIGTGRGASVKGASSGAPDTPSPVASNNYEYIKMGSAQPISPSLSTTNEAAQTGGDFHYSVIDAKDVAPPTHYQEPISPQQTPSKGKPPLAPKPNFKNDTPPNGRATDDSSPTSDVLNSYDRLDHGSEGMPSGLTVRLAKVEGSGYEALQS